MSRITKHRTLSDEELLSRVETARAASDIIEELAQRLETGVSHSLEGQKLVCPHCEAEVTMTDNDGEWELS